MWFGILLGTLVCFAQAAPPARKAIKPRADRLVEFTGGIVTVAAFVNQPLDLDLKTLLKNSGSGTLTWSTGADKPAWITIKSAENRMTGTPSASDVGLRSFRLSVQDGDSGALARVDLTVYPPPKFTENPINLGTQKEDSAWSFDLLPKVQNPGGGKLSFSVENPATFPSWMKLEANGILSGTPRRKDVGAYSNVVFIVTSSLGGTDKAPAFGLVEKTIKPPKWLKNPIAAANAAEDFPYSFELSTSDFVFNPEQANLTYTLKQGVASGWIQLTGSGTLFGTPKKNDLGAVTLRVVLSGTIDGNTYTDETDVTFQVLHTNHPPEWTNNPLVLLDAPVKIPYLQDLAPFARDRDGDPLTFKVVSGPAWAKVTAAGILGGTPANDNFGLNEWTIEVSDGEFSIPTQVRTKVINLPPYWLAKPTVLPNVNEDDNYLQNLISFVKDPDGDPVIFTVVSGPSWGKVSASGAFSGVPGAENIGLNTFTIRVADNVSGADDAEVQVTVVHVNHAPKWTQDPVVLPGAKEKVGYNQSLAAFVTDKDKGDVLTFTKLTGPAWATISGTGQVTGTPARGDVGLNTFKVRVADQVGASAEATVQITVEKTNRPPVWTQDPIDLGETLEGTLLSLSLVKFVVDPDGDPLTFKKINGPAWLNVDAAGVVSGTPARPDAGSYTVVFEVSDGEFTAEAKGNGTVKAKTLPPVIHADQLKFTVNERATLAVSLNQPKFVEDPQGLPLTFKLLDIVPWATLSDAGDLVLKPLFAQIGDHQFRVSVSNAKLTVEGVVTVKVLRDPRPPVWLEDPIRFTTLARVPFTRVIADKAKDLDGIKLTFQKKDGPAWLSVDTSGKISGTPQDADVGEGKFIVTVANDVLSADVSVLITVTPNNHPPYWTQDPVVLANAVGATPYAQDISGYAKDPDAGDVLTISKISGPNWVKINAAGQLSGTPAKTDVGPVSVKVRVTDPSNAFAEANVTFIIEKFNAAPVWLQEPIDFGEIVEDSTLSFDLTKFAFDADTDPLTYKKTAGPAWLFVGAAGDAKGTPMKADIGAFTATLEVSDGKLSAQVKAIGKVVPKNHPPVIHQEALAFTVKERQVVTYLLNDPKYVEDIDLNTLSFTILEASTWVSLSSDGALNLKPLHSQIGTHDLKFRVSDGKLSADGVIKITVLRDPRPPVWLEDPIRFDANARIAFTANISAKASDLDNVPLTFAKKSGPSWLTVAPDGKISGTPSDSEVGENKFVVTATNDGASADANLIINVRPTNHPPIVHNEALAFTVRERQVLTVPLNDKKYIEDVDNDTLVFQAITSLEWVTLTPEGSLVLKPLHPQLGSHTYSFRVSDGKLNAEGTIQITVVRDPRAPIWLQDPIIFNAVSREIFNDTLVGKARDLDGIAITFEKKSGPAWMTVASDGKISGTPEDTDVGDNAFVVTVKNDVLGSDGNVIVKVLTGNHPPIVHDDQLILTIKERQVLSLALNDKKYVEDMDGDSLSFSWVNAAAWASLTADGTLTLKPGFKEIGNHSFPFKVTDGKLTAQGTINVRVLRDPRPPVWLEDPIRFEAKTLKPFTASIAAKVKELDNVPITFTKKSGPAWLTVDPGGNLSGTPPDIAQGENRIVITASNDGTSSDGNVIINVILGNNPPIWTQDPIQLGSVEVGKLFQGNLPPFAFDKDGDALTFEKVSGAPWVFVSPNGTVTGTPADSDVGVATLRVRVSDPLKAFADATATITVTAKPNRPPIWLQDPINLGTLTPDLLFQFDLAPLAKDPDGDGLTFKKVSGPQWLTVASNGQLQGRPLKIDGGSFVAIFEVTDGKVGVTANAFGSVKNEGNNLPPVIKPEALSFVVKERSELNVNLNQPQYVTDPEGDPLTFALVSPLGWITLGSPGQLSLKPLFAQIGDHTVPIAISDDKGHSVPANLLIRVLRDPRPPVWVEDPIRMQAKVNTPFQNSLMGKAKDFDNITLTFSKVSGPTWLNVAENGTLTGTPLAGNLGENSFRVSARNDLLGAEATLLITVSNSEGPVVDVIQVDQAVPGAPSENVWVVDNSWPWAGYNKLVKQMKENINVYFSALEAAGVRSTGLYLSSDVSRWKGLPNQGEDSSLFIQWSDPQVSQHFVTRVDETYNKKCYTSPIWALQKFYDFAALNSEMMNRFFTAGVPMDVLIATPHTDYYKTFAQNTPLANNTPTDYTRRFMTFHEKEKQNYRISAIAPDCAALQDPMEEPGSQTAKDNPYRTLTKLTKGDYYAWDCHFDMKKTLRDYAQKVIFRAYVMAKGRIPLSKKPSDPKGIVLTIGGTILPGNTGSSTDKWTYDAARQEVIIFWNLIDLSVIQPGQMIEIKYNAQ